MTDRSGAKRDGKARAGKQQQDHEDQPATPVYGLTMRRRPGLFLVLCVIFAAWLAFLLVMYHLSR
jgi:hypothetical protein